MTGISRRGFLRIVAAAGLGGFALDAALKAGEATPWPRRSTTRVLMGTIVTLTIVARDLDSSRVAASAALDRMSSLEQVLSHFIPGSQLSRLNRTGVLDDPDPDLVHVLRAAREVSVLTQGAFDITIKPVLDLYLAAQAQGDGLPAARAIRETLRLVDYRALEVFDGRVVLSEPGMQITLDGIAKGYIVDAGAQELMRHGMESVLVEAGGDLRAGAPKTPGEPWTLGIQAPREASGTLSAVFALGDQAAATSGDYIQPFTPDYRQHHILDPRTGESPPALSSATVVAPSANLADALATAVMVLGSQAGLQVVAGLPGCEASTIAKDMRRQQSPGFPRLTS
jgi:thiamine biosynthesis lipoprotein